MADQRLTIGPWEAVGNLVRTARTADDPAGLLVAECSMQLPLYREHAALIAEAGTVFAETGRTPRELHGYLKNLALTCSNLLQCIVETGGNLPPETVRLAETVLRAHAERMGSVQ